MDGGEAGRGLDRSLTPASPEIERQSPPGTPTKAVRYLHSPEKSRTSPPPIDLPHPAPGVDSSVPSEQTRKDGPGSRHTVFTTSAPSLPATSSTQYQSNNPFLTSSSASALAPTETTAIDPAVGSLHPPYRPPEKVDDPESEHPPDYSQAVLHAEYVDPDVDMVDPMLPTVTTTEVHDYDIISGGAEEEHIELMQDSPSGSRRHPSGLDGWAAQVGPGSPSRGDGAWGWGDEGQHTGSRWSGGASSSPVERPQLGRGHMARSMLRQIHPHELVRPVVRTLPRTRTKAGPSRAGSVSGLKSPEPNTPDTTASSPTITMDQIIAALPGGAEDYQNWYFSPQQWGWMRVEVLDEDEASLEAIVKGDDAKGTVKSMLGPARRPLDAPFETFDHFHSLPVLPLDLDTSNTTRIDRVQLSDSSLEAWLHLIPGLEDEDVTQRCEAAFDEPQQEGRKLWYSSTRSKWILADSQLVPGQIHRGLVQAFSEDRSRATGGVEDGKDPLFEAWDLLEVLLANPLFHGQRGWVKLDNKRFARLIGTTTLASRILQAIGFSCRQEEDVLRVGPIGRKEGVTQEQVEQMDQYMLRAWIEISLWRAAYWNKPKDLHTSIEAQTLEEGLGETLSLYMHGIASRPWPPSVEDACRMLGVLPVDIPRTVEAAYMAQCAFDAVNEPAYLHALEQLAQTSVPNAGALQIRVATERSLGKITASDGDNALDTLGYTKEHAELIGIDAAEAPADYFITLFKDRFRSAATVDDRQNLVDALRTYGKIRNSTELLQVADEARPSLTAAAAYDELRAPRNAVDEGLITQYIQASAEYPAKAGYYRACLEAIAFAPEENRPTLKEWLASGQADLDGSEQSKEPHRKDLPVGIQNIGNTCYLNSILQYLYVIKPLREAVVSFEETIAPTMVPGKSDVVRSRQFVTQLRTLFENLYTTEFSSYRPAEELAYFAITRPELDTAIAPAAVPDSKPEIKRSTIDSLPDIPSIREIDDNESDSSTRVGSPDLMDMHDSIHYEQTARGEMLRHDSVLGKRQSQDREETSPRSPSERRRLHSEEGDLVEGDETLTGEQATAHLMDAERDTDDFEMIEDADILPARTDKASSPCASTGMAALDIRSPAEPDVPQIQTPPSAPLFGVEDATSNIQTLSTPRPSQSRESAPSPQAAPPRLPPRPKPVDRRPSLAQGLEFGLQQDSAEVLLNVLNQLEMALDPGPGEASTDATAAPPLNLISSLFSCKFRQQTHFRSESTNEWVAQPAVEGVFTHPIIGVEEEGKDLYDCLAELYLKGDEIELGGQKGYKMDLMDRFPDFLHIQMRRSQYDRNLRRERKINTHIPFPQILVMDRFLAGADLAKKERSRELTTAMSDARSRLHDLRDHKPMSIPETFAHAKSALSDMMNEPDLGITPDLLAALDSERNACQAEIKTLDERLPILKAELESLWTASRELEYELVSVYMHRGKSSGSGHYWTYQSALPDNPQRFYQYNDEKVTETTAQEVLKDRTGDDANPALLCYVRRGKGLVDTLHRNILEMAVDDEPDLASSGLLATVGQQSDEDLISL